MCQCAVRCVDFTQRNRKIFLLLCPCVGAVAVGIGYECGGSLSCADEVPVALALAYKLLVALVDDVVDSGSLVVGESGTVVYLVEVFLGICHVAASAHDELGCIEQGLCEAVDAQVVVEVEVTVGFLILVVFFIGDILLEPESGVLPALGVAVLVTARSPCSRVER